MKMFLSLLVLLFALTGCITSVDFVPYEGVQQQWPTEPGAFVDTKTYALPVYHGRPSRPYKMLGQIEVEALARFADASSAIGDAVTAAKKHGADAVMLLSKSSERGGRVHEGRAKVIAIAWL